MLIFLFLLCVLCVSSLRPLRLKDFISLRPSRFSFAPFAVNGFHDLILKIREALDVIPNLS